MTVSDREVGVKMIDKLEKFICGYTFGFDAKANQLDIKSAYESLDKLIEETSTDTIVLAIKAMQEIPQSTYINYTGDETPSIKEVKACINYIHAKGLKVILKPMVNVSNGTWRGHICFFREDVPGEPTWGQWFKSYTQYMVAYAKLAEELNCYMFVVGCEMVQSNNRDQEWRQLILDVRQSFAGLITYNADKYQEDRILWWDAVDVISSSGYYPIHELEQEFSRIEKVVQKFNKPFFFAEAGCMSTEGSSMRPNNWELGGSVSEDEQDMYYSKFFETLSHFPFIQGLGIWDWNTDLRTNKPFDYSTYNKKSIKVIKHNYERLLRVHN